MQSKLQQQPKSAVLEKGYINIYSELNPKEKRQLQYKRRYKTENPNWDDTLVYLSNEFRLLNQENSVVLDAGCGNGNYVIDENRTKISWAAGVDVDINSTVKNICLDEIKETNLETLPFENNTFDVVVSLWVLEHLENPLKVLSEIHRVLKPNGIFLFATPNASYLPLAIMHALNSAKINYALNKWLFGRNEKDIFETFYKANSIEDLTKLTQNLFKIETVKLNEDPSYSSFNEVTYRATKALLQHAGPFKRFLFPHIVGVLRKE